MVLLGNTSVQQGMPRVAREGTVFGKMEYKRANSPGKHDLDDVLVFSMFCAEKADPCFENMENCLPVEYLTVLQG